MWVVGGWGVWFPDWLLWPHQGSFGVFLFCHLFHQTPKHFNALKRWTWSKQSCSHFVFDVALIKGPADWAPMKSLSGVAIGTGGVGERQQLWPARDPGGQREAPRLLISSERVKGHLGQFGMSEALGWGWEEGCCIFVIKIKRQTEATSFPDS